ncbi:MAG: hypothetical protein BroJett029_12210 [Alphaproteobacteria bacterium]|nr:MAG: hypothetical protein BroJett029_12210 [Alphaproteobacteria bacterium]
MHPTFYEDERNVGTTLGKLACDVHAFAGNGIYEQHRLPTRRHLVILGVNNRRHHNTLAAQNILDVVPRKVGVGKTEHAPGDVGQPKGLSHGHVVKVKGHRDSLAMEGKRQLVRIVGLNDHEVRPESGEHFLRTFLRSPTPEHLIAEHLITRKLNAGL